MEPEKVMQYNFKRKTKNDGTKRIQIPLKSSYQTSTSPLAIRLKTM
jgi:hypothetical protein